MRSAVALEIDSSGDPDDCDGGTSRELRITGGDTDPVLDVQVAVCGEQGQAEAAVIDAFGAPLLALFDMEALLAPSN